MCSVFVFLGVTLYSHRASVHTGAKAIIRDRIKRERVFAMEKGRQPHGLGMMLLRLNNKERALLKGCGIEIWL